MIINFYVINEEDEDNIIQAVIPIDTEFTCESAILLQSLFHLSDKNTMGDRTVRESDLLQIGEDVFVYRDGRFIKHRSERQIQLEKRISKLKREQELEALSI